MCKGAVFACGHADIAYISHTVGQHATGARGCHASRKSACPRSGEQSADNRRLNQ